MFESEYVVAAKISLSHSYFIGLRMSNPLRSANHNSMSPLDF
jgi:hypothetical protein